MKMWLARNQSTLSAMHDRECGSTRKFKPKSEWKKKPPLLSIERADQLYEDLIKHALLHPGEGVDVPTLREMVGLSRNGAHELTLRELKKNVGVIERPRTTQKGEVSMQMEYLVDPAVAQRFKEQL